MVNHRSFARDRGWRQLLLGAVVIASAQSIALPGSVLAQRETPAQLEEGYKRKLELPFLAKSQWVNTLAEAQKISKEKNLPIFGYFTRSYGP